MKILIPGHERPYRYEIYRTGDALFLWQRAASWASIRRAFLYMLGIPLLTTVTVVVVLILLVPLEKRVEACVIFPALLVLLFVLSVLLTACSCRSQRLIRIDRHGIHATDWIIDKPGRRGATTHMSRRLPLALIYRPETKFWHFEQTKAVLMQSYGPVAIKANRDEIERIAEELARFERDVPTDPVPAKYVPPKTDPGRTVLDTMTFQERSLEKIPSPMERYAAQREIFESKKPGPGLLCLRCPECDSVVPDDEIWNDRSLAKCGVCETLFPVPEFTVRPENRHGRVRVTEDEGGLYLSQRSVILSVASMCMILLLLTDLGLYAGYQRLRAVTPEFTLENVFAQNTPQGVDNVVGRILCSILVLHIACLIPLVWQWFGRRRVDFGRETVRFRIGLFFFERDWTVRRTDVGVFFCTTLDESIMPGFRIPYRTPRGTLRRFRLRTLNGEAPGLTSRVYRWCLDHPPHGDAENFGLDVIPHANPDTRRWHGGELSDGNETGSVEPLDTVVCGVFDKPSEEVRLFCPACSSRLCAGEIDVPANQGQCRNCHATFPLEKASVFLLERENVQPGAEWSDPPRLPGLFVQEIDGNDTESVELVVRYRPPRSSRNRRIFENIGATLGMIFLTGLGLLCVGYFPGMILSKHGLSLDGHAIVAMLCFGVIFTVACSPYALIFISAALGTFDELRSGRAAWMIRLDARRMLVSRCYGKHRETVEIDRNRIVEVRIGDGPSPFFTALCGRPVFGRFPSILCSRGASRIELILDDGSIEYLPQPPKRSQNALDRARWLKNRLADFLARNPFR